jgi:hypothetical protein
MGTFKWVAACSDSPCQPPLARTMGSLNTPPTTAAPALVDFLPEELEAGAIVVVVVGAGAFWIKATPWIGVMPPRVGDVEERAGAVVRDLGLVVGGVEAMVVGTVVDATVVGTVVVVVGGGHLCLLQAGLVVVVVGIVVVVRSGRVESVIGEPIAGKPGSAAAGLMA